MVPWRSKVLLRRRTPAPTVRKTFGVADSAGSMTPMPSTGAGRCPLNESLTKRGRISVTTSFFGARRLRGEAVPTGRKRPEEPWRPCSRRNSLAGFWARPRNRPFALSLNPSPGGGRPPWVRTTGGESLRDRSPPPFTGMGAQGASTSRCSLQCNWPQEGCLFQDRYEPCRRRALGRFP